MAKPKWDNKRTTFEVNSGDGYSLRAIDFGNLGIKLQISRGNELLALIVEPDKMDELLDWFSIVTSRPVISLPPLTREVIKGLLTKNKSKSILTGKEKRTLREALTQLRACEKIRAKEGDLLARARNRKSST